MCVLAVLTSLSSTYLSWSSGQASSTILLTAGASLVVSLQWSVAGSLLSLSTVTALSYLSQRVESLSRGSLVYLPSDQVSQPSEARLARTIEEILAICPSLRSPHYIPTFWSSNTWANLGLYFLKQLYDKSSWQSNKFSREILTLNDGGTVSIDFADDDHLPSDSPVVIFLHTITGSGLVSLHISQ